MASFLAMALVERSKFGLNELLDVTLATLQLADLQDH